MSNLNVIQGTSFLVYLNAQNTDGSPINLSGYSAVGYVKNQYSDTGIILNLNATPVQPFNSGIIAISGSSYTTSSIPVGQFIYDVILSSSSKGIEVIEGSFNVYPSPSVNVVAYSGGTINPNTVVSNSSYLTLSNSSIYIYNGSGNAVWVLPSVSNSVNTVYYIKNRGGATLNITGVYPDQIYSTSPVYSFNILSGQSYMFNDDGQYWDVQ